MASMLIRARGHNEKATFRRVGSATVRFPGGCAVLLGFHVGPQLGTPASVG